jgi:hypothetical protein
MGLQDLIRSGVATANGITEELQVAVTHEPWVGKDQYGGPVFGTPVSRQALVEMKQRLRRSYTGQEVMQMAAVTFLVPVEPNGAAGRREPIDPRDRITLPDGTTGPILDAAGLADPDTANPYFQVVALGGATLVT